MSTMSLTAYAETHGVSRQAAKKWQDDGHLVMEGNQVNAPASDAKMQAAAKGRFRVSAHGGRRKEGVRGAIDRPALGHIGGVEVGGPAPPATGAQRWTGWAGTDGTKGIAQALRDAVASGDPEDFEDAYDLAEFSAWDDACKDAGWARWPAGIAAGLAADLGMAGQEDRVRVALERRVSERLVGLEIFAADLADPRLEPR